jgi:signal transduction histidine kinase
MAPQSKSRPWGTFPLKDLVEEVAQSLAQRCKDQAIEITLDVPANLTVAADPTLIRRAVEHLMLGAIAAMPNGGPPANQAVNPVTIVKATVTRP